MPETIPVPLQLNVAPVVTEVTFIVPLELLQFNVNALPGLASGGVILLFTATVAVFVHPFAGSVTVTVYVPVALTIALAALPPETIPLPVQLYVAPGVVELAAMVPLSVVHVSVKGAPDVASGGVVLFATVDVAVFVHPEAGSVTVTV